MNALDRKPSMNRPRFFATLGAVAVAATTAFAPAASRGDTHPNNARGLAQRSFALSDFDNVASFNGNLSVTVPLGNTYPVSQLLSYQLSLVYNSTVLEGEVVSDSQGNYSFSKIDPWNGANAGYGWTLSFGRVLHQNLDRDAASYVGPDGSEHRFFDKLHESDPAGPSGIRYTRDGSFLRLKKVAGQVWIESPDGVRRHIGPDGRVDRIEDFSSSNYIAIEYRALSPSTPDDQCPAGGRREKWVITDSRRPTEAAGHFVCVRIFKDDVFLDGISHRVVQVGLRGFDGALKAYNLFYGADQDVRAINTSNNNRPLTSVPILESIQLPDGSAWSMTYHTTGSFDSDPPVDGRLVQLTLPTGGRVQYFYGDWNASSRTDLDTPPRAIQPGPAFGVVVRRNLDGTGCPSACEWTFGSSVHAELARTGLLDRYDNYRFRERRTDAVAPSGNYVRHYFSIHDNDEFGSGDTQTPFASIEYGLPFTRYDREAAIWDGPLPSGTVGIAGEVNTEPGFPSPGPGAGSPPWNNGTEFLSTRVFDAAGTRLRSTYVRYEYEGSNLLQVELKEVSSTHRRVVKQRSVFHDDGDRFSMVENSDWDGIGGFKQSVSSGDFAGNAGPARERKTVTLDYLTPGPSQLANSPWRFAALKTNGQSILTRTVSQDLGQVGQPGCGTLGYTEVQQTCVSANKGLPLWDRRFAGPSADNALDIAVVRDLDGAGFATKERFYGGDDGSPIGTLNCNEAPAPSGTVDYELQHVYSSGVLKESRYKNGASTVLEVLNQVINPSTGLVASATAPNGLTTFFGYDDLGRMTAVATGGAPNREADTALSFVRAQGATPASVTITRTAGTELAFEKLTFDAYGRLVEERKKVPTGYVDATADPLVSTVSEVVRTTEWDAEGRMKAQSTWDLPGATASKTLYQDFDAFGRARKVIPPDGAASQVEFVYAGNRQVQRKTKVRTTTGNDNSVTFEERDSFGRLVKVIEPVGGSKASYFYDAADRLRKVEQSPNGSQTPLQERFFCYDGRGFLKRERHPETAAIVYSGFDAKGHPSVKTEGGDNEILFTYDKAERLFEVKSMEPTTGEGGRTHRRFTYAAANSGPNLQAGQLIKAEAWNFFNREEMSPAMKYRATVTEDFEYSGVEGRVSKKTTSIDGKLVAATATTWGPAANEATFGQTFFYDAVGNLTSETYPQCSTSSLCGSPTARTQPYVYDHGFLTRVTGFARAFSYHPNGAINTLVHQTTPQVEWKQTVQNGLPRPFELWSKRAGTATDLWKHTYSYDGSGNIKTVQFARLAGTPTSGFDEYRYDLVSRLASSQIDGQTTAQSYGYDAFGNLQNNFTGKTSASQPISVEPANNKLILGTYSDGGQLKSFGPVATPIATYQWSRLGQLNRYVKGPTLASDHWNHIYTASGERIRTVDKTWVGGSWTLRSLDGRVLREYFPGVPATTWATRDSIWRGAALLATIGTEGTRHVDVDHLGTPKIYFDTAGALIGPGATAVARKSLLPYGMELEPEPAETAGMGHRAEERFLFTSHERDNAQTPTRSDDLDYMHARYYSPLWGRFLSVDPVLQIDRARRLPQQWNRYSYALANPLRFLDPQGTDIAIRINFDAGVEAADRQAIITAIRQFFADKNVGTVHVFDGATAKHGSFFANLIGSLGFAGKPLGYATIAVDSGGGQRAANRPVKVYMGPVADLPSELRQFYAANSILHEVLAHHFGTTYKNEADSLAFLEKFRGVDSQVDARRGTLADSEWFSRDSTRVKGLIGLLPMHIKDVSAMQMLLEPVSVAPPTAKTDD
jgi:RHS repeat-associated protein